MLSKEIEQAKDDLKFFNEGEYITREMNKSANVLEEYIERMENNQQEVIKALKEMRRNLNKDDLVGYADDVTDILEILEEDKTI